jgi:uncharacterized protein YciI
MLYTIYCVDKPDRGELRKANRTAHLGYLTTYGDQVVQAGPLLSDDGESMIGSLLIMDLENRAEAEEFVAGDPYGMADLFETVIIARWKVVVPASP